MSRAHALFARALRSLPWQRSLALATPALALALSGCGSRSPYWGQALVEPATYGLANGVALVDRVADRVVWLTALPEQKIATTQLAVGHGVAYAGASSDGKRLFVLSRGDVPRRTTGDEYPSLTVIDASGFEPRSTRYPMTEPLPNLAIDPLGRWAVAYVGPAGDASFVQNPNEIVLFDLSAPPGANNPIARTIRSFGGSPQRLTFTPTLALPGGPRRLLLLETEQDVTLLDLDHAQDAPPRPEITVRLTSGAGGSPITPAGLVVDDGDPGRTDDARVAIRATNDSNLVTLQLVPATDGGPNDFTPQVNLTDVGGIPSDIVFVRTDGGLRVAALVPDKASAILVEPDTSLTTSVSLPAPYSRVSLVTNVVGASAGTDVALLWSGANEASGVAFWMLGKTVGQPYRSLEVVGVGGAIARVEDVPVPNDRLKVLNVTDGTAFYVLDLVSRTASPLSAATQANLSIAPDGARMWAYSNAGTDLAAIDLASLHPVPLTTDWPISAAYDIARAAGGRSLVAVHLVGGVGATIFDAMTPDTANAQHVSGLLLEAP
jgi:hypothetical protein